MKRFASLLAVLLVIFSLVACSSSTTTGETYSKDKKGDQKLTTISVGYMPNYASLNSVVAGMKTGAFKEQGIDVKLVEFADGPTIIAALESGSINVGYIGPGAHVLPIQGQAEIFAFSQLGNADEVIGNVKKGVKTIQDLKGKTIAVATGTSSEQILTMTLAEAGLTTKDVKLMNMDASAIVTAMISGSVDAVATWSPNTNAIKKEMGDDVVMLSNNKRYADKSPSIASWVVKPGYAEKNKEQLEKFTRGLFKGMDYRTDHLDEVAKWVAEEIAVDPKSVLDQTGDGEWITTDELVKRIEDGTLEAYYQKQQENFVEAGRLKKEEMRPVSKYVLFDNMKNAAK
ncbi:ABC transporter substrate-binding protein [Neobacillus citreus]|uniref:ABC transporter substrate-binding protein n=1 Tax=Neobacillus citreus TaxID=2833578 RepID=A0A942T2F8_9BACI|nr:ABC transporter substrate-binding protein [Neobacillus citreus]MCH6267203.1 MetQ/NlpA family ABC transporter substrate-binding protein [Neobacillus citreus]